MSVIGEQIKKYRIERNITQEQLGELIGVTTQAVSRWERGGTPDAEILPSIAEVLGVNIDALFGREEHSFSLMLARKLCQMPREEAYRYAFQICWAIELGLVGDISIMDDFMNKFIDSSITTLDTQNDYFAKVISDFGIANVRLSPNFRYFFFLSESQERLKDQLSDTESLRKVFELFADKNMLSIIVYLYSASIMPIATSLISQKTGLNDKEIERCMKKLCENKLATRSVIATAEGEINAYTICKESFVVPLLCAADEINHKNTRPFLGEFSRKKPLI